MSHDPCLWRVGSRLPLRWRGWDGEWVVFHPESGDTHLLDPLAAEALRYLESAPATTATLVRHLVDGPSAPDAGELPGIVEQLLSVLDDAGLIEPVDDPA